VDTECGAASPEEIKERGVDENSARVPHQRMEKLESYLDDSKKLEAAPAGIRTRVADSKGQHT
jgi:hypothetical protein